MSNVRHYTTFFGEKETLAAVSRRMGIPINVLYWRLYRLGWTEAAAFLTPVATRTNETVAPKGECPYCDRRREGKRKSMERKRGKQRLREKREDATS